MEENIEKKLSLNPWLSLWTKPRQTIETITSFDPNHHIWRICFLHVFFTSFSWLLSSAQAFNSTSVAQVFNSTIILWLLYIIFMSPALYLSLNVNALVTYHAGKIMKGSASFKQVRAAALWLLPMSWVLPLALGALNLVKNLVKLEILSVGFFLLLITCIIWSFVNYLKMLSQVQKFSIWKAFLNQLLSAILFFIYMLPLVVLIGIFYLLFTARV